VMRVASDSRIVFGSVQVLGSFSNRETARYPDSATSHLRVRNAGFERRGRCLGPSKAFTALVEWKMCHERLIFISRKPAFPNPAV